MYRSYRKQKLRLICWERTQETHNIVYVSERSFMHLSFLFISNKFWMGGGGGGLSSAVTLLYRTGGGAAQ